jgi:glyoxylase-like metal-dependent hydrolase (beta-lactamase superfamily II)
MKKWTTKQGSEIYLVLDIMSNVYLISTKQKHILVDTGYRFSYNKLLHNIRTINSDHKSIDILILTHTHFDHCRNAFRIKRDFGSRILVSEFERQYTIVGYTPLPKGTFRITEFLSNLGSATGKSLFGYHPFSADTCITDQYDFKNEGLNIQMMSTSGHSPGSISVIVDNDIAIVGDTMLGKFTWSIFPPFADNVTEMIGSWEKLLKTKCNTFLPGHGKEIKRDLVQKEFMKYNRKYNN